MQIVLHPYFEPLQKDDHWGRKDGAWVRHHICARTQLLDPTVSKQEEGAPCSEDLDDSREAFMEFTSGAPNQIRRDNWRTEKSLDYGYTFNRKTVFTQKNNYGVWRRSGDTRCTKAKRTATAKAANTTRASASCVNPFAIQLVVLTLCYKQRNG